MEDRGWTGGWEALRTLAVVKVPDNGGFEQGGRDEVTERQMGF